MLILNLLVRFQIYFFVCMVCQLLRSYGVENQTNSKWVFIFYPFWVQVHFRLSKKSIRKFHSLMYSPPTRLIGFMMAKYRHLSFLGLDGGVLLEYGQAGRLQYVLLQIRICANIATEQGKPQKSSSTNGRRCIPHTSISMAMRTFF